MSFIPIIARADISTNGDTPTATIKKGKITPTQMAQAFAWTFADKTGILDVKDKCTATASSVSSDNISTVTFNSGYIVIYGRLIECEAGTTVEINTLTQPSGRIILSVDLSQVQENEVKIQVVSSSYALNTNDLNENTLIGKYDFELYYYSTSGTTVSLIRTNTDYVPDISGKFSQFEKSLTAKGKPLFGYDITKGTIEERLTALGFKGGRVQNLPQSVTSSLNTLYRSGNYCLLQLTLNFAENTILYNRGNKGNIIDQLNEMYLPDDFEIAAGESEKVCFGQWDGIVVNAAGGNYTNISQPFKIALSRSSSKSRSNFNFQKFCGSLDPNIDQIYYITKLFLLNFGYRAESLS